MAHMKLENIKIKKTFTSTTPNSEKISACREYWEKYQKQDRYIVVDHNNILIDGYIQYLVLREVGVDIAEIKISNTKRKRWERKCKKVKTFEAKKSEYRECETVYIWGIHPNFKSTKERIWRVPNSWWSRRADRICIGDILMVHTKNGLAPIKVTKIKKLNECPVDFPVKTVVKKVS